MNKFLLLTMTLIILMSVLGVAGQSDTVWSKEIGSEVKAVKFSPDGQFIYAAALGRKPMKLSTETGEILKEYEGLIYQSAHPSLCLDLSKDGKLLYGADKGNTLYIWDAQTGALVHTLQTEYEEWREPYFKSISVSDNFIAGHVPYKESPQGDFISETHIWNKSTYEKVKVLITTGTNRIEFSPDEKYLAIFRTQNQDETVGTELLHTENWNSYNTFLGHTKSVQDIAFSPDGSLLASGGMDGIIKIWDVNQKKLIKDIKNAHGFNDITGYLYSLTFLSNSILISGGSDGFSKNNILVWNWNEEIKLLDFIMTRPNDLSVNNYKLAIADYRNVTLINLNKIVGVNENPLKSNDKSKPNPTNNISEINFFLPISGKTLVSITDANAREIELLHNGFLERGEHKYQWVPKGVPNGIYFCNITGQNFTKTLKIILEK